MTGTCSKKTLNSFKSSLPSRTGESFLLHIALMALFNPYLHTSPCSRQQKNLLFFCLLFNNSRVKEIIVMSFPSISTSACYILIVIYCAIFQLNRLSVARNVDGKISHLQKDMSQLWLFVIQPPSRWDFLCGSKNISCEFFY